MQLRWSYLDCPASGSFCWPTDNPVRGCYIGTKNDICHVRRPLSFSQMFFSSYFIVWLWLVSWGRPVAVRPFFFHFLFHLLTLLPP